jgi:hypothetical protein
MQCDAACGMADPTCNIKPNDEDEQDVWDEVQTRVNEVIHHLHGDCVMGHGETREVKEIATATEVPLVLSSSSQTAPRKRSLATEEDQPGLKAQPTEQAPELRRSKRLRQKGV